MPVADTSCVHDPLTGGDLFVTLPDGRRLGYAEYGDPHGVPIFGLHGTPGSRRMFRLAHETAGALNIRLIAPERPGFGISCHHRGRDLTSYASDLAHFANALGIDRFAVAGVSGGAPYAAACAAILVERVMALGLISPIGPMAGFEEPPPIGPGHYFAFRLAPKLTPLMAGIFGIGRLAFLHAPDLIFALLLSRATPSDRAILRRHDVRRNLLAGVAEGCRPGIAASLQEMRIFSRPWNVPFEDIRAPAFLWQGLGDRNVPVSAALRLGDLIPRCRICLIEGAGHYWIFDNIGAVLQEIAETANSGSGLAA